MPPASTSYLASSSSSPCRHWTGRIQGRPWFNSVKNKGQKHVRSLQTNRCVARCSNPARRLWESRVHSYAGPAHADARPAARYGHPYTTHSDGHADAHFTNGYIDRYRDARPCGNTTFSGIRAGDAQ
jgi:hypothetical protein